MGLVMVAQQNNRLQWSNDCLIVGNCGNGNWGNLLCVLTSKYLRRFSISLVRFFLLSFEVVGGTKTKFSFVRINSKIVNFGKRGFKRRLCS